MVSIRCIVIGCPSWRLLPTLRLLSGSPLFVYIPTLNHLLTRVRLFYEVQRNNINKIYRAKMTGRVCGLMMRVKDRHQTFERPGVSELLDHVRPGDILGVVRLDRLGRSLCDLLEFERRSTTGAPRAPPHSRRSLKSPRFAA